MLKKLPKMLLSLGICASMLFGCNSTVVARKDSSAYQINPNYIKIVKPYNKSQEYQLKIIEANEILANDINNVIPRTQKNFVILKTILFHTYLGLDTFAKLQAVNFIGQNRTYAPAWSLFGDLLFKEHAYIEAYDAYDAALDLDPQDYSPYQSRGLALYYGNRIQVAYDDLYKIYLKDRDYPYSLLLLYMVESKIHTYDVTIDKLRERYRLITHKDKEWANRIIEVILGQKSEDDYWDEVLIGLTDDNDKAERLSESYFYLGKYHQILGEKELAQEYFKLCIMMNVVPFIEHRAAEMEIELYKNQLTDNNEQLSLKSVENNIE